LGVPGIEAPRSLTGPAGRWLANVGGENRPDILGFFDQPNAVDQAIVGRYGRTT
jgi:hypothetical protein